MVERKRPTEIGTNIPVPKRLLTDEESYYAASQWRLMWRRFRKHKLGLIGMIVIVFLYAIALFSPFLEAHPIGERSQYILMAPMPIQFVDASGTFSLRPFVYAVTAQFDPVALKRSYQVDTSKKYYVELFVHGAPYKLWGLIPLDIHLLGVEEGGALYLMGTDNLGRDLYSRLMSATSISLSVGFVGVIISFLLGCTFGGISGYRGGVVDLVIQRFIEFINGIPSIPLWMALSAAVPPTWSPVQVYLAITSILALLGWTDLARTVRGKLLQLREEDFVMAAEIAGASDARIITRHLLPSFMSYLIVSVTLSIPGMIMGETALSFLGLGLRPPTVSWGVLLQDAQNIRSISSNLWLMWPVALIILAILAFNFAGDALRDAADPYATQY